MSHNIPENPTLKDLQEYVKKVVTERGWDKNNDLELFLLFSEEVGELAKAIRNYRGLYPEQGKENRVNLEEEFADVLSYLVDLANYFGIDLAIAFRKKEEKNAKRTWGQ
jgi:NTP pyrophosphatase (non-canonical NTP hydrolase)